MTTNEKTVRSAHEQSDDLEAIHDIGPGYARALNRIGIFTYADLACFTADELSHRLEQAGVKAPSDRIGTKRWIEQATALAEQASRAGSSLGEATMTTTTPEKQAQEDFLPESDPKWRPFAEYTVFFDIEEINGYSDEPPRFQTRVYNGDDGTESIHSGIETTSWVEWILDHVRAKLPPEVQLPTARDDGTSEEATQTLEITDVRIEPGMSTDTERRGVPAVVSFHLSGPNAEALSRDSLPYQVELHSINTEDGTADLLELKRGTLQSGQLEYECRLHFPMPGLGRYQLESIALLMTPQAIMACHHLGPIIKIVP